MTRPTDTSKKPEASTSLVQVANWTGLAVEHRQVGSGTHHGAPQDFIELVHILSGRAGITRRGDGMVHQAMALPGTSWLTPSGSGETLLEVDGNIECLIILLSPQLLDDGALVDHGIDPLHLHLVCEGGFADLALAQICLAIRGLIGRPSQPVNRLYAEGLRTALVAHLIGNYTIDRWQAPLRQPSLDPRRLQRVLSYIDERLGETISLDDLAGEACLSPFHFSRLFQQSMGQPPHRYVVQRRVAMAQERLRARRTSMVEVALDTGFGTQANFSRVFRKLTGLTPREYRDMQPA